MEDWVLYFVRVGDWVGLQNSGEDKAGFTPTQYSKRTSVSIHE